MNERRMHGWAKHIDFTIVDIICIELAYVVAYFLRRPILSFYRGLYLYALFNIILMAVNIDYAVEHHNVFGRVTLAQKRQFIHSLKAQGHTVAMTGDGVNDLLALKDAGCNIAMASGSEVATQVAQVVLLDSDFSRMPEPVLRVMTWLVGWLRGAFRKWRGLDAGVDEQPEQAEQVEGE